MHAEFSFHHLGILCSSIEESMRRYVSTFGYIKSSAVVEIPESSIAACCLENERLPRLELIQPLDADSALARRTAPGGYHIAWSVTDIASAVSRLEEEGYHGMDIFESTLWGNARCVFLVSPEQELVELIESPHLQNDNPSLP